ncbi:MAG: hypothetical protein Tsb002_07580 [Wenzhouxiangellaceae bacterium]
MKAVTVILAVACLATHVAAATASTEACPAADDQALVAHRGARAEWPDNTLAAYQAAVQAGAFAVEVDVRMTADHQLVAMHDPLVNRTTDGHGMVHNLRLEQVRQLRIITAPQLGVPTLREVLDQVAQQAVVMLDLKQEGETYWQALAAELTDDPQRHNIVLGVRSLDAARRLRQLLPQQMQLALSPSKGRVDDFLAAGVSIVRLWPKWLRQRPQLASLIEQSGAALYLPTSKISPSRVRRLLCYQPRYIQTDDPIKLDRTLRQLQAQDQIDAMPQ